MNKKNNKKMNIEPFKIKVKNAHQSRIVQEFMIANGWEWVTYGKCTVYDTEPFLYFNPDKTIYYGWMKEGFKDYPLPRLKYKEFVAKYISPRKGAINNDGFYNLVEKEVNNTAPINYKDYGIKDIIEAFRTYSTNNPADFFRMLNGQVYSNSFILKEMELGSENGRDFVRQLIGVAVKNIQNEFKKELKQ